MGRAIALLGLLIMLLGCAGMALAAPSELPDLPPNAKVVFEAQEITDSDVLLQRAKAGITDLPGDEKEVIASITGPSGAVIDKLVTTQKIKETRWHGGGQNRYVTTAIFRVHLPKSSVDGQVSPAASDDITDPSGSWSFFLTFTYDTKYDASMNRYGQIQSVKGKWARHDSQVTCKDAKLQAGCNGPRLEGGYNLSKVSSKSIGYPSSGTTYSFTSSTFSNWGHTQYAASDGGDVFGCYIAGGGRCTLQRGGSTWALDLDIIKGSMPDPEW